MMQQARGPREWGGETHLAEGMKNEVLVKKAGGERKRTRTEGKKKNNETVRDHP